VKRVLLDSNVFLHALGSDAALRAACTSIIDAVSEDRLAGEAAVVIINEIVHVRHRRTGDRRRAVADGRAAAQVVLLHSIDDVDTASALDAFQAHEGLQMNDAVLVAVALRHGLTTILSTDRGFDGIPGLRRVDPADAEAVAALVASSG
jgi:predicted nucleic acid-binding protein